MNGNVDETGTCRVPGVNGFSCRGPTGSFHLPEQPFGISHEPGQGAAIRHGGLGEKALRIERVSLDLDARIPGIERTTFLELASKASKTCTISAVLNTEITVNFRLLN